MITSDNSIVIKLKKDGFTILSPFFFVTNTVGNFFQDTVNSISQLKKTQTEIENLRNELDQYKKIIIDFNELHNENIRLKRLLNLKEELIYDSVACEVIGRDPKTLFNVIILNKGSKDGITQNMPVISYAGGKRALVGKVVETTPLFSKVITLSNPKLTVGAVIIRNTNRIHTVIKGSNKMLGIAKLLYIPKDFNFSEDQNDYIFTSGDSFIFPSGIEIGKIKKGYPSKRYEIFNEADVQISVDLLRLDYVLVLKINYKEDDFNLLEKQ